MAQRSSWNSVYEGSPPWDIGRPQPDFVRLADAGKFHGHVLDVGCGTGEHVMLAASHGAEAMGVDLAELPLSASGPRRSSGASARHSRWGMCCTSTGWAGSSTSSPIVACSMSST